MLHDLGWLCLCVIVVCVGGNVLPPRVRHDALFLLVCSLLWLLLCLCLLCCMWLPVLFYCVALFVVCLFVPVMLVFVCSINGVVRVSVIVFVCVPRFVCVGCMLHIVVHVLKWLTFCLSWRLRIACCCV